MLPERAMKHQKSKPVHPEVRIGHVHLKVADLERSLAFYRDVLGFELTQRCPLNDYHCLRDQLESLTSL